MTHLRRPEDLFLSIVIPAFNEGKRLRRTVTGTVEWCSRSLLTCEILIVDDGSSDDTLAIANSFAESFEHVLAIALPHRGKGAAVKEGMLRAAGQYILFMDADGATPVEEIRKLLVKMEEGYPVAIGSRAAGGPMDASRQISLPRKIIGRAFATLVRLLAVPGIRDSQCGFKMFRKDAADSLFRLQTCEGFAFDVEILYLARKMSLRVAEVPIDWIAQEGSKVRLFTDGFSMLRDILRIRTVQRG